MFDPYAIYSGDGVCRGMVQSERWEDWVDPRRLRLPTSYRNGSSGEQRSEIAGSELTNPEAAQVFTCVLGKPVKFQKLPMPGVRLFLGREFYQMFRWFNQARFNANIPKLRSRYPEVHSDPGRMAEGRRMAQTRPQGRPTNKLGQNGKRWQRPKYARPTFRRSGGTRKRTSSASTRKNDHKMAPEMQQWRVKSISSRYNGTGVKRFVFPFPKGADIPQMMNQSSARGQTELRCTRSR